MRITFVTTKINFERAGGSVPDLDLKVRDMQARGANVRVITLFSEHNLLPPDLPYPVAEEHAPRKNLFSLQRRAFAALKKYEKNTDVYYIEGQFSYGGALYRLLRGVPVVAHYNREMLVWDRGGARIYLRRVIEKILNRFLVPYIDHFTFSTPQLAKCYADFGLVLPKERVTVINDFFDPEAVRRRITQDTAPTSGTLRVFASGRMIPEKGFDILIDALALLPKTLLADIEVTIGGDGPEKERLEALAKKHGLPIRFPGWISKAEYWQSLGNADVFVLPKWRIEQPSVIVQEALSAGIPTVAPGGGGVEWMAGGAIVPFADKDPRSLSQALEHVLASPGVRADLRGKCARRVAEIGHETGAKSVWDLLQKVARGGE